MMRREAHALGRQTVEIGSPRVAIAVAPEHVAGVIVGEDEQEIRFAASLRGKGRRRSSHQSSPADHATIISRDAARPSGRLATLAGRGWNTPSPLRLRTGA